MSGFFGTLSGVGRGLASSVAGTVSRASGTASSVAGTVSRASGTASGAASRIAGTVSDTASRIADAASEISRRTRQNIANDLRKAATILEKKEITDEIINDALTIIEQANTRRKELTERANLQIKELTEQTKETTINLVCSNIQKINITLQEDNETLQKENERLSTKSIYSILIVKELISLSIKFLLLDILFNIIKYNKEQYKLILVPGNTSEIYYKYIKQIKDYEDDTTENFSLIYSRIIYDENNVDNNIIVSEQNDNIDTIVAITNKHIDIYILLLYNVKELILSTKDNIYKIKENNLSEGNTGEESIINYIVYQLNFLEQTANNSKYNDIAVTIEKLRGGGKYQPKKMNKKDILGKERCIYKKQGDKREYVKYKSELITVKDFKIIMAKKNKAKAK